MMGSGAGWLLLLLLIVLIGAVVGVVSSATGDRDAGDRARQLLRERLATGDIDEQQYRERSELLGSATRSGPSTRTWLPIMLVALAVLVLLLLLVSGMGMRGGGWSGPMDRHMGWSSSNHMGGMMGQRSATGQAPEALPDARQVTVAAGEMWFDPDTIEATAGEPVNLTVVNGGDVFHDLTIDELDLQIDVDPGQRATAGLEIDDPGEYDYYCSVPGHAGAGMRGTLTVTSS
jgi:uncharacterized cupredoxin-like copper-binding protein